MIVPLCISGAALAGAACTENASTVAAAETPDAGHGTAAPPAPKGPLFVGPALVAELGPTTDAGPRTAVDGPVLEAAGGATPDTWTLAETPKSIRVTLPHAKELALRLDDADRLPWPARAERPQAVAGRPLVTELSPNDPLLSGTTYVLVVEAILEEPGGQREWTIPLAVESGASAPTAWQEQPKPTKGKRRKR